MPFSVITGLTIAIVLLCQLLPPSLSTHHAACDANTISVCPVHDYMVLLNVFMSCTLIMPPPIWWPSITYTANNLRTQRPSVPKFGMKVPHPWCDSHTSFKVKRSRSPGPLMLTHPAAYLPMWSYCIPLVGIFLGHFHINLYQTCMQYSNEGPQHWNWALFLKIAF